MEEATERSDLVALSEMLRENGLPGAPDGDWPGPLQQTGDFSFATWASVADGLDPEALAHEMTQSLNDDALLVEIAGHGFSSWSFCIGLRIGSVVIVSSTAIGGVYDDSAETFSQVLNVWDKLGSFVAAARDRHDAAPMVILQSDVVPSVWCYATDSVDWADVTWHTLPSDKISAVVSLLGHRTNPAPIQV